VDWLRATIACSSAAIPLLLTWWLFRRIAETRHVSGRVVLLTCGFGGLAAVVAAVLEARLVAWTGVPLRGSLASPVGAALIMLLVVGPLEEALKIAVVWPSFLRRRLTSGRVGVLHAVAAASGFAACEVLSAYFVAGLRDWLDVLRSTIALPAHLFFASLWGYALGRGRQGSLPRLWLGVALIHGGYDHVVFGRGPALLVVVVPVLLLMVVGTWMMLRQEPSAPGSVPGGVFEPPSVRTVREAMRGTGQPLMVHWILVGALVTLGVTLAFLAAAVWIGHRYGVDFAQVDESELVASVPLALLGSALLAAFPVSGYLVARASGARSVIEPAWSTGAAILVTLGMFSITEPMALVVAASVAPVGFALGCIGAWFGLDRASPR
jgi:hypothetical protein